SCVVCGSCRGSSRSLCRLRPEQDLPISAADLALLVIEASTCHHRKERCGLEGREQAKRLPLCEARDRRHDVGERLAACSEGGTYVDGKRRWRVHGDAPICGNAVVERAGGAGTARAAGRPYRAR